VNHILFFTFRSFQSAWVHPWREWKAQVISKEILEKEKEVVEIKVLQDNNNNVTVDIMSNNVEVDVSENKTESEFVDEEQLNTVDETEDDDDSQDVFLILKMRVKVFVVNVNFQKKRERKGCHRCHLSISTC
jgi:hypothetical protein